MSPKYNTTWLSGLESGAVWTALVSAKEKMTTKNTKQQNETAFILLFLLLGRVGFPTEERNKEDEDMEGTW